MPMPKAITAVACGARVAIDGVAGGKPGAEQAAGPAFGMTALPGGAGNCGGRLGIKKAPAFGGSFFIG